VVLALVVIGLQPVPVFGQDEGAHEEQVEAEPQRRPRDYSSVSYALTQHEVENFSEILELSPEQHETMMEMFIEVRRRVFEAGTPVRLASDEWMSLMQEFFDAAPEERDEKKRAMDEKRAEMSRLQAEFGPLKSELAEGFLNDLQLLLRPDQMELFDDAMRWRHRFRLLRYGMIPYSDFSVADVARTMELRIDADRFEGDERPSLESVYEEYEIELDRFLVRRVEAEREFAGGARGMGDGRSGSDDAGSEEDQEKWHEAVGEVNLRLVNMQKKYIRRIASLLTPEDGAAFQQRCYEKAYWHVLLDSAMDERFESLREHPALTDEQRARVEALESEYRRARTPIEEPWIRAIDDYLADGGARIAGAEVPVAVGDPMGEEPGADTLFGFVKQKLDLRRTYTERLEAIRVEFGLDDDAEQPAG
jgi:hypothetical protein